MRSVWLFSLAILGLMVVAGGSHGACRYEAWKNGPRCDPGYFPIGVWAQEPRDAGAWAQAGINLYVGLWEGPTTAQLDALRLAGMQALTSQNAAALTYTKALPDQRPVIVGWTLPDEPDNRPEKAPSEIRALFDQMKATDPTRPIFLNLSQGLGWDHGTWAGQGGLFRPERDYPAYLMASDIAAFDIYPMASPRAAVFGDAWRVALGVERLRQYAPPHHVVWNFIETGNIYASVPDRRADPKTIRAEVWMSVLHGSRGIVYFIHGKSQSSPFDARALLQPENVASLSAVAKINAELTSLAEIIQLPPASGAVSLEDILGASPVDYTVRVSNGRIHVFAVGMRAGHTRKGFRTALVDQGLATVIGENRVLRVENGAFADEFDGYEAHLYRIDGAPPQEGKPIDATAPNRAAIPRPGDVAQGTVRPEDWEDRLRF
jgi:hypothetical protein